MATQVSQAADRQVPELEAVFDSLPLAVLILNPDGSMRSMNKAALEMHGLTSVDEVHRQGRKYADALEFHTPDGNKLRHAEWPGVRGLSGEVVREAEVHGRNRFTGTTWHAIYSATPVYDAHGALTSVAVTMQEVADRRKAIAKRAALPDPQAQQQEFLTRLLERGRLATAIVQGEDLRFTFVNSTYQGIREPGCQMLGRTYREVFPEAAEQGVEESLREVLRTGRTWMVDDYGAPIPNRAEPLWWQGECIALRNTEGVIDSVLVLIWDISERKKTELALRRGEERFRRVVENIPDVLAIYDRDLVIRYINAATTKVSGRPPSDYIGRKEEDLWPPEVYERWRPTLLKALATGTTQSVDVDVELPFTGRRSLSITAVPLLDDAGQVQELLGFTHDYTELNRAGLELQEADRRKDEFLATLAHELRNPLAPMRNAVQIIRLAPQEPVRLEQALSMMERQLKHMVRLIDDLLDIARISRGQLMLRRERMDLVTAFTNAVETSRPLIEVNRHELELTHPREPVPVDGDLIRLSQVIANMLNNAARYTPAGGLIQLSLQTEGTDAVVRVVDNGIGFAPGAVPRLFEMFGQLEGLPNRGEAGLGIGLALVRAIVEMHGGTVRAESPGPGLGATFVMRIPLAREEAERGPDEGRAPPSASALRVLVADDNQDAANSTAMMLELLGHEVHAVHDGEAALELGEKFRPHVVLLDLGMPVLDGYETAERMRETEWGRSVKIFAVTGWGQDSDREKSRAVGFDGHLVKPVDPHELDHLLGWLSASGHGKD
jgi:PAS domain S-box-containing protein